MPLSVGCKGCGIVLRGVLNLDQENVDLDLTFENADLAMETPLEEITQEVECSGELPVQRFVDNIGSPRLSPFLFAKIHMTDELYESFSKKVQTFIVIWKDKGSEVITASDLYSAANYEFLLKFLKDKFPNKDDATDRITVISHYYDTMSRFITLLLPPNSLAVRDNVLEYAGKIYQGNSETFEPFFDYLYNDFDLHKVTSDGFLLLKRFLQHFSYYIPVICLSYFDEGAISRPYGNQFYITTVDFDRVKQTYADSYEWLSKILTIYMGIENIHRRNDFNSMPNVPKHNTKNINSLSDFYHAANATKKDFVDTSRYFSNYFNMTLDNQLRNAVNHFKTNLDSVNQIIEYFPFNDQKRSNKSKRIYLIDFVDITYRHVQRIYDALFVIGMFRMSNKR